MPIFAYSYRRISSHSQTKRSNKSKYKEVDSLDTQEQNAEAWVNSQPESRDIQLDTNLRLEEVVSGSTGQNIQDGVLASFIEKITNGEIQTPCYLLLDEWARFSRLNPLDQLPLFANLASKGVTLVTLDDNAEYNREKASKDSVGVFVPLVVKMSNAAGLSDKISKKNLQTWERRRKASIEKGEAYTSRCPAWLKVVNKNYIQIPENVKIVKRIFKMALNGINNKDIATELNSDNITTFTGKPWLDSSTSKILSNEAVTGWHTFKQRRRKTRFKPIDHVLEDGSTKAKIYPPIISQSDFDKVRKMKMEHTMPQLRKRSSSSIFAFLVFCGYYKCACNYKGNGKGKNKRYSLYVSRDWKNKIEPNHRQAWQSEALEKAFLEWYTNDVWNKSLIKNDSEREKNVIENVAELSKLIDNKQSSIDRFMGDLESDDTLVGEVRSSILSRVNNLSKEKNNHQQELNRAKSLLTAIQEEENNKPDSNLLKEFEKNKDDTSYRTKLNLRIRDSIDKIELFGGGYKYDSEKMESQLRQLDKYIRKECKVVDMPHDKLPNLSLELWKGLDDLTYNKCHFIYENFWLHVLENFVPKEQHAEAFSIYKPIPNNDTKTRFFKVHQMQEGGYTDPLSNDRIKTIKPKERTTKGGGKIFEDIDWIGEGALIRYIDKDFVPPYYSKIFNPKYMQVDNDENKITIGLMFPDGKFRKKLFNNEATNWFLENNF